MTSYRQLRVRHEQHLKYEKKNPAAATNKRQLVFINTLASIQFILTKKYNINEFNHMGLLISHEYRELKDVLNEIKGVQKGVPRLIQASVSSRRKWSGDAFAQVKTKNFLIWTVGIYSGYSKVSSNRSYQFLCSSLL